MASARYRKMRSQVAQLARSFLPRDLKKDILDLPPRVSLRALSFRILSHAEIESYLEDRAIELARAADEAWKKHGHVSRVTLCLLAFLGGSLKQLPGTLRPPPNKKQADWDQLIRPDKRLSQAISTFNYRVSQLNHGIKEENLVAILLPLGIDPDIIDEVLLADLNDLGAKRGESAHGGSFGQVSKGVNPRDEYAHVMRALDGLKAIDKAFDDLRLAAAARS